MTYQKHSRKINSLFKPSFIIVVVILVTISLHPNIQVFADHGRETKQNQAGHEMIETEMLLQSQPQSQSQSQQQVKSGQHDAKGHEQHQVVYFQEYNNGTFHTGTVSFNSSLPTDIMSFVDVSRSTNSSSDDASNSSKSLWYSGSNILSPTSLLKNATTGTVEFDGNGVVAHRAQNDTFTIDYNLTISDTLNKNTIAGAED